MDSYLEPRESNTMLHRSGLVPVRQGYPLRVGDVVHFWKTQDAHKICVTVNGVSHV